MPKRLSKTKTDKIRFTYNRAAHMDKNKIKSDEISMYTKTGFQYYVIQEEIENIFHQKTHSIFIAQKCIIMNYITWLYYLQNFSLCEKVFCLLTIEAKWEKHRLENFSSSALNEITLSLDCEWICNMAVSCDDFQIGYLLSTCGYLSFLSAMVDLRLDECMFTEICGRFQMCCNRKRNIR